MEQGRNWRKCVPYNQKTTNEFLVSKETVSTVSTFISLYQPLSTRLIKPNFCKKQQSLETYRLVFGSPSLKQAR